MNAILFVLMLAILAPGAILGSELPELPRDVGEWVRVLVPLRIQVPVSGLHGTEWTSELTAWNEESVAIVQGSPFVCRIDPCPPPLRQKPDAVWSPYSAPARGNNRAVILFVERRAAASVWFALTLHERFTAELTAIPVVREDDFLRGGVVFPDVPVSAARRIHVRIYDPFNEPDSVAEVVIEDALTREILSSSSVALEQAAPNEPSSDFDSHPAYGQISDLSALLRDGYTGPVLVRITMNDERPFWTFISLTDNVTQDVTIITPQ